METQTIQNDAQPEESGPCIRLTKKAVEVVRAKIQKESLEGYGLRVAVVGGGCSGFQYGLDFENETKENDTVLEQDGLKIYLDEISAQHLKGTVLDYVVSLQKSGFKFVNPNATRTCGCGESFS
jgi:iron-sulfur cluster assembly accessory protein